jgi:hypothetical protein
MATEQQRDKERLFEERHRENGGLAQKPSYTKEGRSAQGQDPVRQLLICFIFNASPAPIRQERSR